jgi:hypothetical protein
MADSYRDRDPRERDIRFFSQLPEEERMRFRESFTLFGKEEYPGADWAKRNHEFDTFRHAAMWFSFVTCSFSALTYVLFSVSGTLLPIRDFALKLAIPLFLIGFLLRVYDLRFDRRQRPKRFYYAE